MTFYVRLIPFWLGYSQRAHLFTTGKHRTNNSLFDSWSCPGDVYGLFSWRNMKFVSVSRKKYPALDVCALSQILGMTWVNQTYFSTLVEINCKVPIGKSFFIV